MFQNIPVVIKKYLYEMMKEEYFQHENTIDRVASPILAQKDGEDFLKFIQAVYLHGFEDAVKSYRDQAKKMGYQVDIVHKNDGF